MMQTQMALLGRAIVTQTLRAMVDRYKDAPLVLLIIVALPFAWFLAMSKVLSDVTPPGANFAVLVTSILFQSTFVLIFISTALLTRFSFDPRCPMKGTSGFPIAPTQTLLLFLTLYFITASLIGGVVTLPAIDALLLPRSNLGSIRIAAVYGLSTATWIVGALFGFTFSRITWLLLVYLLPKGNLLHNALHSTILSLSMLPIGLVVFHNGDRLVLLPNMLLMGRSGLPVELLFLVGACAMLGGVLLVERRHPAEQDTVWLPLRSLPIFGSPLRALAFVTLGRLVRDPKVLLSSLVLPLSMIAFAVLTKLYPGFDPLAPVVRAMSQFVIPVSLASLPLAADLYTLRNRWTAGHPISPLSVALGEALACTLLAVPASIGLMVLLSLVLPESSLSLTLAFIAEKTQAMLGISLGITCLMPIRSSEGGLGQTILLGIFFTTGTALMELGFQRLIDHLPVGFSPALGLGVAGASMIIGVGMRTWITHRRTNDGPASN